MALLYVEKFAKYSDDQHIIDRSGPRLYTSSGTTRTIETAQGRFGGNVLQIGSTATLIEFPWATVTAATTAIIGFAMRDGKALSSTVRGEQIITLSDTADQSHWRLDYIIGGLALYRANGVSPILVGVATDCIATDRWHWIEIKALMATSGNVEVRVDGVTVLNVAGDFRDSTSDPLTRIRLFGSRYERQYDELIICDSTGSTFNDFFGDTRIVATVPDADGSVVNWTASAGTNVSCVDDALGAYNDDTDYISSSTADQESLFSHAPFTLTGVNVVKFVQLSAMARDDGTNTFRQLMRSGGTTYDNGADINPDTTYDFHVHRRELDPNGAIAWTETSINAAEFGVRARP